MRDTSAFVQSTRPPETLFYRNGRIDEIRARQETEVSP
jgi:hypothetical protein